MPLETYEKKRNFRQTSEPKPAVARRTRRRLRFVVQEHHASRLHFDLRLEAGGVLKSWAVPKGPSLNPADKRLAVMTEDHPVKYLNFEGHIPAGNYGAGDMAIWDSGTYEPLAGTTEDGVDNGKLVFRLHGEKLNGEFHMVQLRGEENQWLLFKGKDEYADPNWKLEPVITAGQKIEASKPSARKADSRSTRVARNRQRPGAGKSAGQPDRVVPMLATLADAVPAGDDYLYELKWDGFRAICFIDQGTVRLVSRNHNDLTPLFPEIIDAVRSLGITQAVLDGEIVALDENGAPSFQLLQNRTGIKNFGANKSRSGKNVPPAPAVFYLFDLLHHDGRSYTASPLRERRVLLQTLLANADASGPIRFSDAVTGAAAGAQLLAQTREVGLEGVVAKEANSPYLSGRSARWLKLKVQKRQDVVIAGFTEPRGNRKHFGALIAGLYRDGDLQYAGHVGGGFNTNLLQQLYKQLKPLETKQCPFATKPATNEKVHWVEPTLACEVKFTEWTSDGRMRHPIFLGLRLDKSPAECIYEEPVHIKTALRVEKPAQPSDNPKDRVNRKATRNKPTKSIADVDELFAGELSGDKKVRVDGHVITLTNLDKVYWPKQGYTKGDMLRYYWQVSGCMLPHLNHRPLILQRFPNGIEGNPFFQHSIQQPPEFLRTWELVEGADAVRYAICDNLASLLYLANLGTIAQNPWHSRAGRLDYPDWIAFDLDPQGVPYNQVCEVALALQETLNKIGLEAYPKTSGSAGMHVYLPLQPVYSYEQVQGFALLVANLVQAQFPNLVTVQRMRAKRGKRHLYLDCLQNEHGKSVASVYSVRARPGATVSAPLTWAEVKRGVRLEDFDIITMPERLKRKGDLFKAVLDNPQRLETALPRLEKLLLEEAPDAFMRHAA